MMAKGATSCYDSSGGQNLRHQSDWRLDSRDLRLGGRQGINYLVGVCIPDKKSRVIAGGRAGHTTTSDAAGEALFSHTCVFAAV